MMFLVMYFISFAVSDRTNSDSSKNGASLLPPVALVLGANNLGNLERQRVGVTSSNVNEEIEHYQFATCLIMMVIDTAIFTVLGLYFEQVWPNDVGKRKPWHFLCSWCCKRRANAAEAIEKSVKWGDDVEDVDQALEQQKEQGKAMLVRGLTKKFKNKVAVEDLNLDIYEGQIFALLGHNGAGKTTTISMLTGLYPATKGEMTVHGKLLSSDLDDIRKKLGVCPQHNVLFKDLTVEEHLYVFSVFKGQTDKTIIKEKANEIIDAVDLRSQMKIRADRLSGGQKRKLSLALALIGESPIVFLDEPTAGMDITARRQMWDMLKNNKAGRIILLTTHYMEEADILADRIAIISEGQLRCCGSPLYLKNRFGVGYYLNLVKEAGLMSAEHSKRVTQFVQRHVPSAVVMNDIPGEISYQMPIGEVGLFKDMFMELDHKLKELGLHSYGISVTTLEEVFLKVAQGSHKDHKPPVTSTNVIQELPIDSEVKQMVENPGVDFYLAKDRIQSSLLCRHMQALLRKRFLSNIRDIRSIICEILVPIVLVLLGLGLIMISYWFKSQDAYDLTLTHYSTPQSVLYGSITGVTVDPIANLMGSSDLVVPSSQGNLPLEAFDQAIFDQRIHDPYRMGSFYFYKADNVKHQYEVVVFHNQTAYQSSPTYFALISQAIIRSINPAITIEVINHPLPITHGVKTVNGGNTGFISSVVFALGFAFIPVGIISYIVLEREMSIKHQQLVSGVSLPAYWATNYIWDFSKHFIPAVVCALFVLAFQIEAFTYPSDSYGVLWLLMILYGFSVSTFTYFTSFFFKTSSTAQSVTLLLHFIAGSILPSVIFVMYLFDTSRGAAHALIWIFRFIPNFCFGMGLMNLGNRDNFAFLDGETGGYEPFDLKSAGGDILMLGLTSVFYIVLLFFMEWVEISPSIRKCLKGSISNDMTQAYNPDDDVEAEKQKAASVSPGDAQVILRNIRQVYRNLFSKPVLGVDEVSVTEIIRNASLYWE
jgi:ATP-binding cassette subfamily A (ABC1) protein 3